MLLVVQVLLEGTSRSWTAHSSLFVIRFLVITQDPKTKAREVPCARPPYILYSFYVFLLEAVRRLENDTISFQSLNK
jgi:hypothetical protein